MSASCCASRLACWAWSVACSPRLRNPLDSTFGVTNGKGVSGSALECQSEGPHSGKAAGVDPEHARLVRVKLDCCAAPFGSWGCVGAPWRNRLSAQQKRRIAHIVCQCPQHRLRQRAATSERTRWPPLQWQLGGQGRVDGLQHEQHVWQGGAGKVCRAKQPSGQWRGLGYELQKKASRHVQKRVGYQDNALLDGNEAAAVRL
eukprot:7391561-Prymnesium_polylepis.1